MCPDGRLQVCALLGPDWNLQKNSYCPDNCDIWLHFLPPLRWLRPLAKCGTHLLHRWKQMFVPNTCILCSSPTKITLSGIFCGRRYLSANTWRKSIFSYLQCDEMQDLMRQNPFNQELPPSLGYRRTYVRLIFRWLHRGSSAMSYVE